jgi:AcrR family transcriptional regulator
MGGEEAVALTERGQRRASMKQARSRATQRSLVHAAVALWRANGYANTTVADICRAAGVSKSLFFFYFPRKEDILAEMGVLSTQAAHRAAHDLLQQPPYEVPDVIAAVVTGLERQIRRNPPELVVEIILEGYRQQHRILASGELRSDAPYMFTELFETAQADGKLPPDVDTWHLAELAQSLVTEGARLWAAGAYGEESLAEVVSGDIAVLIAGLS